MPDVEKYEILVLGSGEAGKYLAWTMAKEGRRTALVERRWLGGSCPNIACLPSKNLIHSAKVASLAQRGREFGVEMDSLRINMAGVQLRKREMVEGLHQMHAERFAASGAELMMGEGRFVAPRTVEIALKDGGTRRIVGERVFLTLGSRSTMPIPMGEKFVQYPCLLDMNGEPDRFARQRNGIGGKVYEPVFYTSH
jgi:pyruvate/2-oxoglutarate dehydrogenase complex dihydrolipoamide dehydrogenase (E3) component